MNISALLTSAGINIGLCALMLSLYSVLRKQPGNVNVYFTRRIAQERLASNDSFSFERFVPNPSWILKAWEVSEEELMSIAGLDAVVFLRVLVFSMRIFSIAAIVCVFLLLPLNYHGQETHHLHLKHLPSESLDVFTIGNVKGGSRWLWIHCLSLYIISISACILLYLEYRSIAMVRLAHLSKSLPNPSHFTVLVRAVPEYEDKSFSDTVKEFFSSYHPSSYLSHQMIYGTGKVQKLMSDAEDIYRKVTSASFDSRCMSTGITCGFCGSTLIPCTPYSKELQNTEEKDGDSDHSEDFKGPRESAAAFVFFRNRYAASVVAKNMQSSNPMIWVTDIAPEPHDVYWSNLWIPYRQLWFRRICTLLVAIVFLLLFLVPVTFVQGLTQLEQLQKTFPFLKRILRKRFMSQLVTGYLPSVILQLFLLTVPPVMMLLSSIEAPISRSSRKKSACCKVLYFTIWNVFFVNVLSGSVISQLSVVSSPRDIPTQLARAVPRQATFFITYILTSGWASLSGEVMQIVPLLCNFIKRLLGKSKEEEDYVPSFPYHTEVPRVLLFGLLGFTCSILAPLILPFLLVYFFLAYVVYRNQFLNVYCLKYESGGQMWPIVHNTTIFSLVLTQIIALGVFGLKESPVASCFTIILLITTLLFNEYCRQRFRPVFESFSAQDLIEMDQGDERSGRIGTILDKLPSAYCQHQAYPDDACDNAAVDHEKATTAVEEKSHCSFAHPTIDRISVSRFHQVVLWLSMLVTHKKKPSAG